MEIPRAPEKKPPISPASQVSTLTLGLPDYSISGRQDVSQLAYRALAQEAAETEQSAQREAEKVQIGLTNNGGSLAVRITNDSLRTVTDIQLTDVTPEEVGPWRSWKPNPNVGRSLSTTSWSLLHPGTDVTVALWLLDENGAHVPRLPSQAAVKIHFRDSDGQWWAAVTGRTATRIDPPASTA
ncbi:hypothetical protein ACFYY9_18425 [Streptomyces nigra]|uniref:hypothetical protein n=1 Tax=Streptomyces nigra TaxID=1827580 RepID=UPI0036CB395C